MPSPIGHVLAGVAAAWTVDLLPGNHVWNAAPTTARGLWARAGGGLTALCAGLGAAPDLDLLVGGHRTATHSLTAVALVGVVSAVAAAASARPALRMAFICAAAYGSHLVLDLVAVDQVIPQGIQLLWPFSHRWFITGWNIFPATERKNLLSAFAIARNARAGTQEIAIMTPILMALWFARKRARPATPGWELKNT